MRFRVLLGVLFVVLSACGDDLRVPSASDVSTDPRLDGVQVIGDLRIEIVAEGLVGPTQFVVTDTGFLVAQINGGENDAQGQIVEVPHDGGPSRVMVDGLDKPTGLALVDDELWIMERDRLSRGPIGGDRTVVLDDLPNNGRSEGTLTVLPDGQLLFDTSGSKRGANVVDGSGRLFTIDPAAAGGSPVEVASGFKHAYAHVVDAEGTIWTTEMTDGSFDGQPAPDEVLAVANGVDHGWPHCVGDNRVVAEFDGSAERCAASPRSQAILGVSATPTGVAIPPFGPEVLWVSLWNENRVVAVSRDPSARPAPLVDVLRGIERPQHLVTAGDAVYLSDFLGGRLLRIAANPSVDG